MSKTHQKKRNTGLLYEFLIHYITKQLVENQTDKYTKAVKILKKAFRPNAELTRELKLIRSLVQTSVSSPQVAADIMFEARKAVRGLDSVKLDREKSFLIKDINYNLNEDNCFYDANIDGYKLYATLQTLFNDWRDVNSNLGRQAVYTDVVVEHLLSDKKSVIQETSIEESPGHTRLLMKIMTQKLNEKYEGVLNSQQKALVRAFAFSTINENKTAVQKRLAEAKDELLKSINAYMKSTQNDLVKAKLQETQSKLEIEDFTVIDENTVARFMVYLKLNEELNSKDDNEANA